MFSFFFSFQDITGLKVNPRLRRVAQLLPERPQALTDTPRTLTQFAERNLLRVLKCITALCLHDLQCPPCLTTAHQETWGMDGRTMEEWTPTKETCGKKFSFEMATTKEFYLNQFKKCCFALCSGPMHMRAERQGRDDLREGPPVSRGRSSFNERDERRPMVMNDQVSSPDGTVNPQK